MTNKKRNQRGRGRGSRGRSNPVKRKPVQNKKKQRIFEAKVPSHPVKIRKQNNTLSNMDELVQLMNDRRPDYVSSVNDSGSAVDSVLECEKQGISLEEISEVLNSKPIPSQSVLQRVRQIDPDRWISLASSLPLLALTEGLPITNETITTSIGEVGKLYAAMIVNLRDLVRWALDDGVTVKADNPVMAFVKRAIRKTNKMLKNEQIIALSTEKIDFMSVFGSVPLDLPNGERLSWPSPSGPPLDTFRVSNTVIPAYTLEVIDNEFISAYNELVQIIATRHDHELIPFDAKIKEYDDTVAAFALFSGGAGSASLSGTSLKNYGSFHSEIEFPAKHRWLSSLALYKLGDYDTNINVEYSGFSGTGAMRLKMAYDITEGVEIIPTFIPMCESNYAFLCQMIAADIYQNPPVYDDTLGYYTLSPESLFQGMDPRYIWNYFMACRLVSNATSNYICADSVPIPGINLSGSRFVPDVLEYENYDTYASLEERYKVMKPMVSGSRDGNLVYGVVFDYAPSAVTVYPHDNDTNLQSLFQQTYQVLFSKSPIVVGTPLIFDPTVKYDWADTTRIFTMGLIERSNANMAPIITGLQDSAPTMGIFETSSGRTMHGFTRTMVNYSGLVIDANLNIHTSSQNLPKLMLCGITSDTNFNVRTFGLDASFLSPCALLATSSTELTYEEINQLTELWQQASRQFNSIRREDYTTEFIRLGDLTLTAIPRLTIQKYSEERSDLAEFNELLMIKGEGGIPWLGIYKGLGVVDQVIKATGKVMKLFRKKRKDQLRSFTAPSSRRNLIQARVDQKVREYHPPFLKEAINAHRSKNARRKFVSREESCDKIDKCPDSEDEYVLESPIRRI